MFDEALENIAPLVEVKVAESVVQRIMPVDVRPARREAFMRWLVEYSRKRNEKSMPARLAGELLMLRKVKVHR